MKTRIKSNSYWESRAIDRHVLAEQKLSKYENEIRHAYDYATRALEEDIQTILGNYQKYVSNRFEIRLTKDEARDFLNATVDPTTMNQLRKKWSTRGVDIDAVLEQTGNYASRITNKQMVRNSVDVLMNQVAQHEVNISKIAYTDLIHTNYDRKMYDISVGTGIDLSIHSLDLEDIQDIMNMNWSGEMFSDRIWANTNVVAKRLKSLFTQQQLANRSTREMIDELAIQTDMGKYASARLIRTEAAAMRTTTERQASEELGITHYRILATLDMKTSEICQRQDGKIYPYAKQSIGLNAPPFHPNCRSIAQDYFDDVDYSKIERVARNPKTNKVENVPADMTYSEWIKAKREKYGDSQVDTWIKQKKNETRDRGQHRQYRSILGKEIPKTFEDFQELKYNKSANWNTLQDHYFVKSRIKNGRFGTVINSEKQAAHMQSTVKLGKSYLFDSVDPQKLFNQFAGTGSVEKSSKRVRLHKEQVDVGYPIGIDINTGKETTWIKIHHSKNRTHIVPYSKKMR